MRCSAAAARATPPLRRLRHRLAARAARSQTFACADARATETAVRRAAAAVRARPDAALVLALDAGTSGCKAAAVARSGAVVAAASAPYARGTAVAGTSVEQYPADWLAAAAEAATRCVAALPAGASVEAVALCGQMQDVVLVADRPGKLARASAVLYSDTRADAEAADVDALLAAQPALCDETTNLRGAGEATVPAKLLWLARHEPAALARARTVLLGAHSVIAWALSAGGAVCDATTASTTGMLARADARTPRHAFCARLLPSLGLDASLLPSLLPPSAALGTVTALRHDAASLAADPDAHAASFPACLAGLPLFHGGGDLAATSAGAGGGTHLYIGTSGWLATEAAAADVARPPPRGVFEAAAAADAERVIRAASATTAGGAVEWARHAFFDGAPASALSAAAATSPPGAGGALFLPHLAGERAPFRDGAARGALLGLSAATRAPHLARCVLEGVAFHFRALHQTLPLPLTQQQQSAPLCVVGGGASSAVWLAILADVLRQPLTVPRDAGFAAARGAAGWALTGLRAWGDAPDGTPMPPPRSFCLGGADDADANAAGAVVRPDAARAALYDSLYGAWRRAYPALAAAGLQGGGCGLVT